MSNANKKTIALTVNADDFKRIKQGTPFQKGVNLLAMILKESDESAEDFCNSSGIIGKEKMEFLAESRADTLAMLLKNPPPGVDLDALKAFCE